MVFSATDGRAGIDAPLVKRLIAAQFPQWADLPVVPVERDGNDNRTYRLGEEMTVRLPTAAGYVAGVAKENAWLPRLAPHLPLPIPKVLGTGAPGQGYPHPWSVRNWLPGTTLDLERLADPAMFATDLAAFIHALQACGTTDGPLAGAHSFYRGASPAHYDDETRRLLAELEGRVDTRRAAGVWEAALAAEWTGAPVWFHGDLATGNLLIDHGRLSAVIDFGTSGVGDPACDLVIAWVTLTGRAREAFRGAVRQDSATWARARGWALWKALIQFGEAIRDNPATAPTFERVISDVLDDHDLHG
ncbi:aminoglycoside phosphotransferase family protein [Catenulispora sp. NF23]|uniref:aminoglycoside phosphotransferase family protein n=1 Tax=Catenulispora pinistramenti TaxID=2705254 RepID=UPI001BAC1AB2|nr:aminoglycoside phosphotransferase family protein [Catenulispora pinistramenti]MBS2539987.1 aminoglycoside phosphotransferase family protein [Catenulispora pinistramenti]